MACYILDLCMIQGRGGRGRGEAPSEGAKTKFPAHLSNLCDSSFRSERPGDSCLQMMIRGLLRLRVATIRETQKTPIRALTFGQCECSQLAASSHIDLSVKK